MNDLQARYSENDFWAILYFSIGLDLGNKIASDSFYEELGLRNPNHNPNLTETQTLTL